MRILIIAIYLATTAYGFLLKYLTYSWRDAPLPENVRDVFDEETYRKNRAYKMVNLRFSIFSGLITTVIELLMLLFNFHHTLFAFISAYTSNIYAASLFIFFIPMLIVMLITQLIGIYDVFVIEERYGFNKMTPATYIIDFVKMLLITLAIAGGLLSLFILLDSIMGAWVFLSFFFVLVAFQLFMAFISPLLIRVFNKLTPLEDGSLKDKIEGLAKATGYKLKGIYIVDASRRSAKLNAFASGFGKTKTIGLFDTLLEKMTDDETVAILAHEIGHAKKRHIIKSTMLNLATLAVALVFAYFIVAMPEVSQAFGFETANLAFSVYILFVFIAPVMLIMNIPANALSRRFEYEADAFEKEQAGKGVSISALKKLYKEDLGDLAPHPFVVMVEYSHPTLSQRVAAFDNDHC